MHDHSYKGTTYPNWWSLESHSYAHYMNFHVSFSAQAYNFEIWTWIKLRTFVRSFKILYPLVSPTMAGNSPFDCRRVSWTWNFIYHTASPCVFLQHKQLQHGKYHRKNTVILKPLGHDFLGFWLTEMESWDITNAGHLSKHVLQVWNKLRQLIPHISQIRNMGRLSQNVSEGIDLYQALLSG